MRKFFVSVAVAALLAACSPPASQDTIERPDQPPMVAACNDVAPDAARQVSVGEEVVTAAATADLRGGSIAPGAYDLATATQIGSPTGWNGTRAVSLAVTEEVNGGVIFNWSGAPPSGERDTWSASFTEAPQPHITFTCGRIGGADIDYAVEGNGLVLRMPDGANGALALTFERRT